jgi:hypothetical protein
MPADVQFQAARCSLDAHEQLKLRDIALLPVTLGLAWMALARVTYR